MILINAKVDKLIDVREVAWSYKRDFSKTKFKDALAEAGIEYFHIKELGNPKAIRKSALTSEEILNNYSDYLNETGSGISTLLDIINSAIYKDKNICLTCFEKEHTKCHRSIIIDYIISKFLIDISVFHL